VRAHRALRQALRDDAEADSSDDSTDSCDPEEETEAMYRRALAALDATMPSRPISASASSLN
jgi:hypothetical protein